MYYVTKTQEEFEADARSVHGDTYTYENFVYTGLYDKSFVTCAKHGDWETNSSYFLTGAGCPECRKGLIKAAKLARTLACFKKTHNDVYTYANFEFLSNSEKTHVTCPRHGDWLTTRNNHLRGSGCPGCDKIKNSLRCKHSWGQVLAAFKEAHNDKYTYDNFVWTNRYAKSYVTCPIHGDWLTSSRKHTEGNICPTCSNSLRSLKKLLKGDERLKCLPRLLYGFNFLHEDTGVVYYKIGVCSEKGLAYRYSLGSRKRDGIKILDTQVVKLTSIEALTAELYILNKFHADKEDTTHILKICRGGTETFSINLNDLYPDLSVLVKEALAAQETIPSKSN